MVGRPHDLSPVSGRRHFSGFGFHVQGYARDEAPSRTHHRNCGRLRPQTTPGRRSQKKPLGNVIVARHSHHQNMRPRTAAAI